MPPSLKSTLAAGAVLAALAAQTASADVQKLAKRYVGADFETDFGAARSSPVAGGRAGRLLVW